MQMGTHEPKARRRQRAFCVTCGQKRGISAAGKCSVCYHRSFHYDAKGHQTIPPTLLLVGDVLIQEPFRLRVFLVRFEPSEINPLIGVVADQLPDGPRRLIHLEADSLVPVEVTA